MISSTSWFAYWSTWHPLTKINFENREIHPELLLRNEPPNLKNRFVVHIFHEIFKPQLRSGCLNFKSNWWRKGFSDLENATENLGISFPESDWNHLFYKSSSLSRETDYDRFHSKLCICKTQWNKNTHYSIQRAGKVRGRNFRSWDTIEGGGWDFTSG